jgi:hypothetical protein
MRNITPTGPRCAATDLTASSDAASSNTMALSALRLTREAIARWTGSTQVPAHAPRDVARVSPQARWLAKTQQDLAAWIECGGFSQIGDADHPQRLSALPGPVMYDIAAARATDSRDRQVDAYAD